MEHDKIRIFVSYAHEDDDLQRRLSTHLKILGRCEVWNDRAIGAGQEWESRILAQLASADIVVMLISADFLTSDFIRNVEIPQALALHRDKQARVVPVLGRHVEWYDHPLAKLQAFPADDKWMTGNTWSSIDEATREVTKSIKAVIAELDADRQREREKRKANEEDYRREVAEALSDHRISALERETLEEVRERLGLAKDVAERIEAGEMQPIEEKRKNLKKYEQAIELAIAEYGDPFNATARDDLGKRQSKLGLQDEDVAGMAERVVARLAADQAARPASPVTREPAPAPAPVSASRVDEDPFAAFDRPPAAAPMPAAAPTLRPSPEPAPARVPVAAPAPSPAPAPASPPAVTAVTAEENEAAWAEVLGQGVLRAMGDLKSRLEQESLHVAPRIPKLLLDHVTRKNKVGDQVLALVDVADAGRRSDCLIIGPRGIMFTGSGQSPGRLFLSYAELIEPDLDFRDDGNHLQVGAQRYLNLDLIAMDPFDAEDLFQVLGRVAGLCQAWRQSLPEPLRRADAPALGEQFAGAFAQHEELRAQSEAAWLEVWRRALFVVLLQCTDQKLLPTGTLHLAPDIPAKKLRNALASMQFPAWDSPFALLDVTVFGSASDGLLFGTHAMYLHNDAGALPGAHTVYYSNLIHDLNQPVAITGGDVQLTPAVSLYLGGTDGKRVARLFEALRGMRADYLHTRENHPDYLSDAQVHAVVDGLANRSVLAN